MVRKYENLPYTPKKSLGQIANEEKLDTIITVSNLYDKELSKIRIAISNIMDERYNLNPKKKIKIEGNPRDRYYFNTFNPN